MKIAAEAAPLKSLIDPDHSTFLRAANMPEAIGEFCKRTVNLVLPPKQPMSGVSSKVWL